MSRTAHGREGPCSRTHGREVVISTTNRNFIGRMGSKDAPIYLARSAWELGYTMKKWPGIKFSATRERVAAGES